MEQKSISWTKNQYIPSPTLGVEGPFQILQIHADPTNLTKTLLISLSDHIN